MNEAPSVRIHGAKGHGPSPQFLTGCLHRLPPTTTVPQDAAPRLAFCCVIAAETLAAVGWQYRTPHAVAHRILPVVSESRADVNTAIDAIGDRLGTSKCFTESTAGTTMLLVAFVDVVDYYASGIIVAQRQPMA